MTNCTIYLQFRTPYRVIKMLTQVIHNISIFTCKGNGPLHACMNILLLKCMHACMYALKALITSIIIYSCFYVQLIYKGSFEFVFTSLWCTQCL